MSANLVLPHEAIQVFCQRNQIRKLAFLGSVLDQRFRPESDVDVLVEFEPEARVSLLALARMERELAQIIGRKVDLRTPEDLSRYFRQEVLDMAEVQYERTG